MDFNFTRKHFRKELVGNIKENNISYENIFRTKKDDFIKFYREKRENKCELTNESSFKDTNTETNFKYIYISLNKPVFMFREKPYHIMCTRFNHESWYECIRYHENNNLKNTFIYNVPVEINNTILLGSSLFVFEMNNTTNEIMGISFLKNKTDYHKKYKVYKDGNYNRFHYITRNRYSRECIQMNSQGLFTLLTCIEFSLFKSKQHAKRGHGISYIPYPTFEKYYILLVTFIYYLFIIKCINNKS